ncbi:MAG: threonine--tRNA ligase, partial [Actinomycetota bacterium]|nr:threonine--tRNA ligase [Actinomycetota bacterium]
MVTPSSPVQPALRVRVPAGTTVGAALREGGAPTSGSDAVVVARDEQGVLRDLAWVPDRDAEVEAVAASSSDGRSVIRHSCAHVLAQAVQQHFPGAKLGIGPPVADGFYYDFDVERPFTPEDLADLEKTMRKIIKSGQRFSRRVLGSVSEAKRELADEPYKLELVDLKGSGSAESTESDEIMEVGAGELTMYDNVHPHTGDTVWSDLCRGPHVPTTRYVPAFRLMRTAAAYWRGSERNPQLQRIYGTAWESTEALERHLELLAEAQRRDHRRLGVELDLFSFPDEIGSGLPVFHPRGGTVRMVMEDYSRRRHEEAGYEFVNSPHI